MGRAGTRPDVTTEDTENLERLERADEMGSAAALVSGSSGWRNRITNNYFHNTWNLRRVLGVYYSSGAIFVPARLDARHLLGRCKGHFRPLSAFSASLR